MHVIEVLGPGCDNCQHLERTVREVIARTGVEAEIRHIVDYGEIASRGVMSTPGLVIDGVVVSVGRIPTSAQVEAWLGAA
ncbi:MAG: thioredoxin family protein [Candidatus Limnocylindrales bacterium]